MMTIDKNDVLNSILKNISNIDYVKSEDIPNIDLYMDQVTSFMEKELKSTKRNPDDKILTKTMINNYAKNDLLPPPEKKKYSKEHLMVLTFIYYLKNILSIKDIEMVLSPITEKYFHAEGDISVAHIYDEIWSFNQERIEILQDDIKAFHDMSLKMFSDVDEKDRKTLQYFAFVCSLSFDVYMKKQIIEKLIDALSEDKEEPHKKKK